ncbi:MAG: zinc-ribbon domain-containing protein [Micromonosporaceae bacterium]
MLIIFGLTVIFRTVGEGVFHCPKCGGDRQYRLRSGRRFFTVFFLPIIPLGKVGEHVQCMTCRSRYPTQVLNLPTVAQMSAALPAGMRSAAVAMLQAGGAPGAAARQQALDAIRGAGANGYGPGELDADLGQSAMLDTGALGQVGAQLTAEAREWFLAQVVRIALADGPLSAAQRDEAKAIGEHLGMTPAQTLGVIIMTEQAARRD